MLLIDGVKYELWTPTNEDEFERVVKEHTKDIFGNESIYLDLKQKLKSGSGIGSIPDGYTIVLGDKPEWHIVEVELSSHPLDQHIVAQVSRFITGIGNPNNQRVITNAIHEEISSDDFLRLKLKKAIEPKEIYHFLSDLISKLPVLTIIIEENTQGLKEALGTLAHPQIKVVEFQTFTREGVGLAVHAHLFEPLYAVSPPAPPPPPPPPPPNNSVEIDIRSSNIKYGHLRIPRGSRQFFPGYKLPFDLETDIGVIKTWVSYARGAQVGDPNKGQLIRANLAKWYRKHPAIKVGDKVIFTVIEPMKRYRLEILG